MEHSRMSVTARIAILVVVSQVCAGLDLDSLITNAVKQVKQVAKQPDAAKVDGECHALCETMYTSQCLRHNCKADPAQGVSICKKELDEHRGPLANVCTKGCVFTPKMQTTDCSADFYALTGAKKPKSVADGQQPTTKAGCIEAYTHATNSDTDVITASEQMNECLNKVMLEETSKLQAQEAKAMASGNMCSEKCQKQFIDGCLPQKCKKGDGVAICKREIQTGQFMKGPAAKQICKPACRFTSAMNSATCADALRKRPPPRKPGTGPAVPPGTGPACTLHCEHMFVNACLGHHCRSGEVADGVQQCIRELNENSGPLAQACAKGCSMTEKMKNTDCTHEFDKDPPPPMDPDDPTTVAKRDAAKKRSEL